jgi:hypothetical protein
MRREWSLWSIALIAAGAAMAVGPFLPFVRASAAFVGDVQRSGLDVLGAKALVVIGLGVAIALLGFSRPSGGSRVWLPAILGAAGLAVGGWYYGQVDAEMRITEVTSEGRAAASVGTGLWVVFAGAGVTVIAAALGLRGVRKEPPSGSGQNAWPLTAVEIILDLSVALEDATATIERLDSAGVHKGRLARYRELRHRVRQTVDRGEPYH